MACRGVFFALDRADEEKVLGAAADSDQALIEVIQDIEERWESDWLAEVDKSWDAMHRCLGDGTLDPGSTPLSRCVLGGRPLHGNDDYLVSYLSAGEVEVVSAALAGVERGWFERRYGTLERAGYEGPIGPDDLEYTWDNFTEVRGFFEKAARAGRATIFTVDQ